MYIEDYIGYCLCITVTAFAILAVCGSIGALALLLQWMFGG